MSSISSFILDIQAVRFMLVGIINTGFGYLLFAALTKIGFAYPYAMLGATCGGILFNFKSFGKFVFYNSNHKLLYKFIILYIALYFISILFICIGEKFFHNAYISGCFAIFLTAAISYFCNKHFIFTTKKGNLHKSMQPSER